MSDSYDHELYASTCLIGFDFAEFSKLATVDPGNIETFFAKQLEAELEKATKSLQSMLASKNINHHPVIDEAHSVQEGDSRRAKLAFRTGSGFFWIFNSCPAANRDRLGFAE
ncbi:hypothetical protein [Bradyrhizobium sacchari]|uniref:hypothetical protein n=1 Tax=Bradyrhizobium sacchari TaxID=1399419 RepID=UPI0010A96F6B|nr:hypothetical protein [Bradyrhizobium sacchari]